MASRFEQLEREMDRTVVDLRDAEIARLRATIDRARETLTQDWPADAKVRSLQELFGV